MSGKIYVVAGPPASGKGTQCKRLADAIGLIHLSTGDIFRTAVASGSELGQQAKAYLDAGQFVPDQMVINFIKTRLSQPDVTAHGCMLDGFPRTEKQARELSQHVDVHRFIVLQVPDKALQLRAADRRIDPETNEIYNLKFRPPPDEVVGRLVTRQYDDDRASFQVRLDTYHAHIRRILPVFEGKIWTVDGMRSADEVFADLKRCLEAAVAAPAGAEPPKPADVPFSFKCPISLEVMEDPVTCSDGHSYERKYIEQWLTSHNTSPRTGAVLQGKQVMPAHALRMAIAEWADGNGATDPVAAAAGGAAADAGQEHGQGQDRAQAVTAGVTSLPATTLDEMTDASATNPALDGEWPEEQDGTADAAAADEDWPDEEPAPSGGGGAMVIAPADVQLAAVVAPAADPDATRQVVIQIEPHDSVARSPTDVCCVVDISGSMGSMAMYETEDGQTKHDGLNILDLVKHAINTIAHILGPEDRLAVVPFSTLAGVCVPLTLMDEAGRAELMTKVDALRPNGRTNIWDGCLKGMEALRVPEMPTADSAGASSIVGGGGRRKTLLLLTDGQPNINPPRGTVAELLDYKDKYPDFQFQLNTFGFGYDLNSELLAELATEGNGTYAFIPDAVILGTVFVNSIANVVATKSQFATVSLVPKSGATFDGAVVGQEATTSNESWGRAVTIGPLQFGQPRQLVVPMKIPADAAADDFLEVTLTYTSIAGNGGEERVVCTGAEQAFDGGELHAILRGDTVQTGYAAVKGAEAAKGRAAQISVTELGARIAAAAAIKSDGRIAALKGDVDGRMSKALMGKARFDRWGKHYLRALIRAHQLQVCTNFMDPGLQIYGGALFKQTRDRGDKVFLELPAPTPQTPLFPRVGVAATTAYGAYTATSAPAPAAAPAARATWVPPPRPQTNMQTYYAGSGGGCFGADATVVKVSPASNSFFVKVSPADATITSTTAAARVSRARVSISDIRAGDVVEVADGGTATVVCSVRIARPRSRPLCRMIGSGLTITPRHPIRAAAGDAWVLPIDGPGPIEMVANPSGYVWTLMVDRCHVVPVNGVQCITWGHGITDDATVRHPFLGSAAKIVANLQKLPGWDAGRIEIDGCIRNADHQVVGFTHSSTSLLAAVAPRAAKIAAATVGPKPECTIIG